MTEDVAARNIADAKRFYESGLSPKVLAELAHETDFTLYEA